MIKRITNLNGISLDTNALHHGEGEVFKNKETNMVALGRDLLIRFNVSINSTDKISNAKLFLPVSGLGAFEIEVREVTEYYYPDTVNGLHIPAYNESITEHYEKFSLGKNGQHETKIIPIDLTKFFIRFQGNTNANRTIIIRNLASSGLTVYTTHHPDFSDKTLVVYESTYLKGINPYFNYLTGLSGYGGVSYINTFTGILAHRMDLFQTSSKKFPIKLSCYYSDRSSNVQKNSITGKWRMSFDYGISLSGQIVSVATPEGPVHYFEKVLRADAKKYEIYITGDYCYINFTDYSYITLEAGCYKINDRNGNTMLFDSAGFLKKISKKDGSYALFTNNGSRITKITSDDGYVINIGYDANSRILYADFVEEDRRVEFAYPNDNMEWVKLNKITYTTTSLGVSASYAELYVARFNHSYERLDGVNDDITKEGLYFEYTDNKVTKVINNLKNDQVFTNRSYRSLAYNSGYTKITDSEGNEQSLVFDDYGMLSTVIDKYGNASNIRHISVGLDGLSRRVSDSSNMISNAKNLIIDPSFETAIDGIGTNTFGWKTDRPDLVSVVKEGLYGKNALKITKSSNTAAKVSQIFNVANSTYSLAFYAKTKGLIGSAKVSVMFIGEKVIFGDPLNPGGLTIVTQFFDSDPITVSDTSWKRFVIPGISVTGTPGKGKLQIFIDGSHTSGELLIDEIMLVNEGKKASYNLITNGFFDTETGNMPTGFTKSSTCTSSDFLTTGSTQAPFSSLAGGKVFLFNTAKDSEKYLSRIINIKGNSGDEFTLAFFGKCYLGDTDYLAGQIIFSHTDGTTSDESVEAEKACSSWQMISRGVTATKPYTSVEIRILYKGANKAYVDAVQLYKETYGKYYQYDNKGNIIEAVSDSMSDNYITNGSNITENSGKSGDNYRYFYDIHGRITGVKDAKGNKIDITYQYGNPVNTIITANINGVSETIGFTNTFDSDNKITASTDELDNTTSYTYDSEKRLRTITDASNLVTTNSYNDYNNLVQIIKSKGTDSVAAGYQYNDNHTLKKIICENGTNYEFLYDVFGRVLEIKLNGITFVSYEYNLIKNGLSTDNITKQVIGTDEYDFLYDNRLRLKEIRFNGETLVSYEYDNAGNIVRKTTADDEIYLDYDAKGKPVKETRSNGDTLKFDYDNLGQLQKSILDINGFSRNYDYEYTYEYDEYNDQSFKTRVDKVFNDEIIDYNGSATGLYGARPLSIFGVSNIDAGLGRKVFRLNKMSSRLEYMLKTVNENRKNKLGGGLFDLSEWKSRFTDSKSIFGWFRFGGTIGYHKKILAFGTENTDKWLVTVSKVGSNLEFIIKNGTAEITRKTIPDPNDFIFIALRIYKTAPMMTGYVFMVNNAAAAGSFQTTTEVPYISRFTVGDRFLSTDSVTSNLFQEDISFLSIGAYPYQTSDFEMIREQYRKHSAEDYVAPSKGVSFIDPKTYEGFEVMTLNGTLMSDKGKMPADYEYIEGTYKLDKVKLFKYDHDLKRHVYGSYSKPQGFSKTKGLLVYDHDLTNMGVMSLNFKFTDPSNANRTLLDFRNGTASKLKVYVKPSGYLALVINGVTHNTDLSVSVNEWHRILLTFYTTAHQICIYLDDYSNNRTVSAPVNVSDTKLVVGSSLLTGGTPFEHIEGTLEMLGLYKTMWYSEVEKINGVLKGSQLLSVKTEVDVLGRSTKEIIDTGIILNAAQGTTKTLVTQYLYKAPGNITITQADVTGNHPEQWFNIDVPQDISITSNIRLEHVTGDQFFYDSNNNLIGHFDGFILRSETPFKFRINNVLMTETVYEIALDSYANKLHIPDRGEYNIGSSAEIMIEFVDTPKAKTSLRVESVLKYDGSTDKYEYDNMGNITKIRIKDPISDEYIEYEYEYDFLSRLIMEYNPEIDKTTKYTYGSNSNIQHVMICTGKTNNCEYEMSYSYDSNYKDRVVEIEIHDNVNITHTFKEFTYGNTYGSNPDHFAGMDMIWNGRRLIEVTDNNKTVEYTYNEAGIRTSRTVNGVTTQYHLLGDNIISLTKGNDKLFFHYNNTGMVVGFEYNKENYFYHRDLTGVITSVIDKNGDIVIKYIYDAWGNWLNKESAALTSIGSILLSLNPFIYKGYVYDSETDLYYLKSRYYSPSIRRFINADSEIGDVGDLENYNLFAYCMNNPVMYLDSSGNKPQFIFSVEEKNSIKIEFFSFKIGTSGYLRQYGSNKWFQSPSPLLKLGYWDTVYRSTSSYFGKWELSILNFSHTDKGISGTVSSAGFTVFGGNMLLSPGGTSLFVSALKFKADLINFKFSDSTWEISAADLKAIAGSVGITIENAVTIEANIGFGLTLKVGSEGMEIGLNLGWGITIKINW